MTTDREASELKADLLNCPFCGGEPSPDGRITYSGKQEAWWPDETRVQEAFFVHCLKCSVDNKGLLGHQTQAEAIAAWNTRHSLGDRESIARIVDSDEWAAFDRCASENENLRVRGPSDFCKRSLAKADAIIALSPPPLVTEREGWLDIESAPRGETALYWRAGWTKAWLGVRLDEGLDVWFSGSGVYDHPTQWRPLPPPPLPGSGGER